MPAFKLPKRVLRCVEARVSFLKSLVESRRSRFQRSSSAILLRSVKIEDDGDDDEALKFCVFTGSMFRRATASGYRICYARRSYTLPYAD